YVLVTKRRPNTNITPVHIYDINQLEAMHLGDISWREVDAMTIRHCFCKAGILPDAPENATATSPSIPISSIVNQQDPVADAEKQLEAALDNLASTGALQPANHMSLDALLNPEGESDEMDKATVMKEAEEVIYLLVELGGLVVK
ncbi:hypothetical protein H0H81_010948, partial [Sphagnurus paluster]